MEKRSKCVRGRWGYYPTAWVRFPATITTGFLTIWSPRTNCLSCFAMAPIHPRGGCVTAADHTYSCFRRAPLGPDPSECKEMSWLTWRCSVNYYISNAGVCDTQSDVKLCDDGILIQLLPFWTLSMFLFLYLKTTFRRQNPLSETSLNIKTGRWIMSKKAITVWIYRQGATSVPRKNIRSA
jgi:hypothetical protein